MGHDDSTPDEDLDWVAAVLQTSRTSYGKAVVLDRADVDESSSLAAVLDYAAKRRWHVVEGGNSVVVLCTSEPLRVHQ